MDLGTRSSGMWVLLLWTDMKQAKSASRSKGPPSEHLLHASYLDLLSHNEYTLGRDREYTRWPNPMKIVPLAVIVEQLRTLIISYVTKCSQ